MGLVFLCDLAFACMAFEWEGSAWLGYTLFVCIGNAGNGLFGIHGRFGLMLKSVSCLVCFNRVVMTIRGKYN